jgi:glycosyltransferase involved in cell wall biosynthesis
MNDPNIPIVVAAYNRPESLTRLLSSLQKAAYPAPVKLILSIDGNGPKEVVKAAETFHWPHGEKQIIRHKTNLGLRRHILSCGDLSSDYDGIILLEDDLYVSPWFYHYARLAMNFYHDDDTLAGVALYAHGFNETAWLPFTPLSDGSDVFFLQIPCSWGQCWTRRQWTLFRQWLDQKGEGYAVTQPGLPENIAAWPEASWKKYFTAYMIEHNLFFVYPRQSYTTNFHDKGVNSKGQEFFQAPLQYGEKLPHFVKPTDSRAVYDAFCEMVPDCLNKMTADLKGYDYAVDLYGAKALSHISSEYLLTSKPSREAILSFGRKLHPIEANIIEKIAGTRLFLTRTRDCASINRFIAKIKTLYHLRETILYHCRVPDRYIKKMNINPIGYLLYALKKQKHRRVKKQ